MSMRGPFCLLAGYFEVGSFVAKDAKRSRLYWDMYFDIDRRRHVRDCPIPSRWGALKPYGVRMGQEAKVCKVSSFGKQKKTAVLVNGNSVCFMIVEAGVRFPSGVFISDTCDKDSSDRCRGDVFPFGGSGCRRTSVRPPAAADP